jgi:hypothetical protein
VAVQCKGKPPRLLSSWRGQRLRIVAAGGEQPLLEDPRMVTVFLKPAPHASGRWATAWPMRRRMVGLLAHRRDRQARGHAS